MSDVTTSRAGSPCGSHMVEALVHDAAPELTTAFPDFTALATRTVEVADRCHIRVRICGVHTGPYLGIGPTGRSIDVTASIEVDHNSTARPRIDLDRLEILAQLGAVHLREVR